eukprot:1301112-Heterocapsa_arctica.AAC.1
MWRGGGRCGDRGGGGGVPMWRGKALDSTGQCGMEQRKTQGNTGTQANAAWWKTLQCGTL